MKISPSLASANQLNLGHEIERLGENYPTLHIDIEDGNFVPNITFGLKTIKAIRQQTSKPFSVHLMVTNPLDYLDELATLHCEVIFVHVESTPYLLRVLNKIHDYKILAGLALNPISNIENVEYLIQKVDKILYMSSEPDGKGDQFIPGILSKIKKYPHIENWLDGGIQESMLEQLAQTKLDHVVMGREVFLQKHPACFLKRINGQSK